MREIHYPAVIVAALVAFLVGAVWYTPLLFGDAYSTLRGIDAGAAGGMTPPPGEILGELVRVLVVAYVLARFIAQLGITSAVAALRLGLWVWLGFQAMLLLGAVLHEGMPFPLWAIHAGDALVKTLLMSLILGRWKRPVLETLGTGDTRSRT